MIVQRVQRRLAGAMALCALAVGLVPVPAAATSGAALIPSFTLVVSPLVGGKIPFDAVAVALNVTVTEPVGPGYVTVYPCGDRPGVSNLNYVAGQTVPNFVIAAMDEAGDVCIDTIATTDVIVDIAGYVPAGSPLTLLEQPTRFLDTRDGTGAPKRRVLAGETLPVRVAGSPGVPSSAAAVVFNATAVIASGSGFVTVFPCGRPIPETSTLNVTAGSIVPNLVTTAVGADGTVCIYSSVDTDLVGDVAAYLPAGSSGVTLFDAPKRVVDTRSGIGGPAAPLASLVQREVTNLTGVPAGATAVIANLTATEATAAGWMSAFPCGPVPPVSNVNYSAGQNIANHAYVPIVNGRFCLVSNQQTHAVVDIAGYVTGAAAFVPMTPERLYDSREQAKVKCNLGVSQDTFNHTRLMDLTTWTQLASFDAYTGLRDAAISPDCSRISFVHQPSDRPFASGVLVFDRAGSLVDSLTVAVGDTAFVTDLGIVAFSTFTGRVYDAETNEVLFTLPNGQSWRLADVSGDGGTLLFGSSGGDWAAFDVYGGYLGPVAVPVSATKGMGSVAPNLSPDGTYASYLVVCAAANPQCPRSSVIVATLDGTVVDQLASWDTPLFGAPAWASDGSMILSRWRIWSLTQIEVIRWELFNQPTIISSIAYASLQMRAAR